jgi:hypothetical protein
VRRSAAITAIAASKIDTPVAISSVVGGKRRFVLLGDTQCGKRRRDPGYQFQFSGISLISAAAWMSSNSGRLGVPQPVHTHIATMSGDRITGFFDDLVPFYDEAWKGMRSDKAPSCSGPSWFQTLLGHKTVKAASHCNQPFCAGSFWAALQDVCFGNCSFSRSEGQQDFVFKDYLRWPELLHARLRLRLVWVLERGVQFMQPLALKISTAPIRLAG